MVLRKAWQRRTQSQGGGVADRDPELLTPGNYTTSYHTILTFRHGLKFPCSRVNIAQKLRNA